MSELEEDIIKKEILPVVTETIEPALKQVQRELVLVVDYHPGMPISVSLSRKTNMLNTRSLGLVRAVPQRLPPKQAYVSIGRMAQYCKSMMLQQHLLLLSLKQG